MRLFIVRPAVGLMFSAACSFPRPAVRMAGSYKCFHHGGNDIQSQPSVLTWRKRPKSRNNSVRFAFAPWIALEAPPLPHFPTLNARLVSPRDVLVSP